MGRRKYLLEIKEEARLDILHSYQYYEEKQPGLGEQFLTVLDNKVKDIVAHPEYYSYIASGNSSLRDVALKRFPYLIVYEVLDDTVIIYAVPFTRRKPRFD